MTSAMTPEFARRYLTLLGVEVGPPTLGLLRALVRSHVQRIPFENISKLHYLKKSGFAGYPISSSTSTASNATTSAAPATPTMSI